MAFDPALVLNRDPTVRLVNSYEAVLSYVQARLSGADYTAFQAAMTSAGLPLTSSGILSFPNPSLYIDALSILAINFVSQPGRHININTISAVSSVVAALNVEGNATVGGQLQADSLVVEDDLAVVGDLNAGSMDLAGDMAASSTLSVMGGIGVGKAAPGSGVDALGTVRGSRLVINGAEDPLTVPNGTLAEDGLGDAYYKGLDGRTRYLTRPQHDTGWIDLSAAGNAAFADAPNVGPIGVYNVIAAAPNLTPDIYGGTPMTLAAAPGDLGGPCRVQIWFRSDESAFSLLGAPPAATGTLVAVPVGHHTSLSTNANMRGVMVSFDTVTLQMAITMALGVGIPTVAGFGYTDVQSYAATYPMALRVMVWTR